VAAPGAPGIAQPGGSARGSGVGAGAAERIPGGLCGLGGERHPLPCQAPGAPAAPLPVPAGGSATQPGPPKPTQPGDSSCQQKNQQITHTGLLPSGAWLQDEREAERILPTSQKGTKLFKKKKKYKKPACLHSIPSKLLKSERPAAGEGAVGQPPTPAAAPLSASGAAGSRHRALPAPCPSEGDPSALGSLCQTPGRRLRGPIPSRLGGPRGCHSPFARGAGDVRVQARRSKRKRGRQEGGREKPNPKPSRPGEKKTTTTTPPARVSTCTPRSPPDTCKPQLPRNRPCSGEGIKIPEPAAPSPCQPPAAAAPRSTRGKGLPADTRSLPRSPPPCPTWLEPFC